MYKWIVIGGGVQGCSVASRLLIEKKVTTEELLIIDPHAEPLEMWQRITSKIGMQYLRSPVVHHLEADPYSLKKFAKLHDFTQPFKGKYGRPRLDLFNDHSLNVVNKTGVRDSWRQGLVNKLAKHSIGWEVSVQDGQNFYGERVILAIGVNNTPHFPTWAQELQDNERMNHIFDLKKDLPNSGNIIVVGGGMTAAQLASNLSKQQDVNSITLVKRHPFRIHRFDSDPGWLGPKFLTSFDKLTNYKKRREVIQEARYRGSITKDVYINIKKQINTGKLHVYNGGVVSAKLEGQCIQLLTSQDEVLSGDAVLLSTGAEPSLPGREWLKEAIDHIRLPCAPCGFPIVSKSLEWKNGLFVTGALAELEIGPVSRNIAGARKATERILQTA
ncbi:FAD/NAD(P)-binding protein [Oceanobacillus kimchii]|uniref:L-lysine N6-monooxygenase MbtG n=1 Tax=Oceanobacillus kimchii TaxID=746691 RepID=A0ABQ5TR25_9BACI|nr:FAD/NAD(P)-binding protein [Oceanobacillus kimchii]GLO68164.1 SidA/IucD/PvdA family monooxygenase [Oceanobacillus kimchii]